MRAEGPGTKQGAKREIALSEYRNKRHYKVYTKDSKREKRRENSINREKVRKLRSNYGQRESKEIIKKEKLKNALKEANESEKYNEIQKRREN
jgi:hypothetical protein